MTFRIAVLAASVLAASAHARADQPPPNAPQPAQAPRASTPPLVAQAPTPAPTPAAKTAAAAPAPRRQGQPVNVKIDITFTDQRDGAPALKKTVSVVTGDAMSGFIRTQASYSSAGEVWLNIDTEPEILPDGKIRTRVNVQYDLPEKTLPSEPVGYGRLVKTQIRENLALILESGKSIVAAQSADPVGDRQVTIEVKATILR